MRSLAIIIGVVLLAGVIGGGAWVGVSYWAPGTIGTPSHAGAVSNGHPEACTNVSVNVRARSQATTAVTLVDGDYVRGTFEADGGFGSVDMLLRLLTPNGDQIMESPRASNYDFTFPAKMHGAYTFVFDNRYSMYTSKTVALFYCIERAMPRGS